MSASNSASSARHEGTRSPRWSLSVNDVEMPNAPASRFSPSSAAIAPTSSGVAMRSQAASPMTYHRRKVWPTMVATLTPSPPAASASR